LNKLEQDLDLKLRIEASLGKKLSFNFRLRSVVLIT
jgi:hypothetical protein